jgi:hypothetical protein
VWLAFRAARWSWALFASWLGVPGAMVIPVPMVLLAILVTWLLVMIIAVGPGRCAARVAPAALLRAE